MFADDVALTVSALAFKEAELILSLDISAVINYLTNWRLRLQLRRLCVPSLT